MLIALNYVGISSSLQNSYLNFTKILCLNLAITKFLCYTTLKNTENLYNKNPAESNSAGPGKTGGIMTPIEIALIVLLALNILINSMSVYCCIYTILFSNRELQERKKTTEAETSAEENKNDFK